MCVSRPFRAFISSPPPFSPLLGSGRKKSIMSPTRGAGGGPLNTVSGQANSETEI